MSDDFAKMSKSARRRARKKLAAAGGQPAPERPAKAPEPDASRPKGDGTRQLTISLKPRHWEVFDWLCGGLGPDMQSEAATKIIREYCVKQYARWRDAQGMKSGSVRAEDFKADE